MSTWKKTLINTVCSIGLCGLIALVVFTTPRTQQAAPSSSQAAPLYTVGEYNGKIAVYHYGDLRPFQILESNVSQFPAYDRQLLEQGITVRTESDLIRVLEDYSE